MKTLVSTLLRKGDLVMVTTGKDRNKSGKILQVLRQKGRVLVEKTNMVKRHGKATQKNPQGGIVEKEASIAIGNVMLVCSSCQKPTRIKQQIMKDGKKARVCTKCKAQISHN